MIAVASARPLLTLLRTLAGVVLTLVMAACGTDEPGHTLESIHDVAANGDTTRLRSLIRAGADADVRDACAWTPLMNAALHGRLETVDYLLAEGAGADPVDKGNYSAMMLAASNNHTAVVARLLDAGADIDRVETTNGWTALIWAARLGHRETVDLLRARGADRSIEDRSGHTADDFLPRR